MAGLLTSSFKMNGVAVCGFNGLEPASAQSSSSSSCSSSVPAVELPPPARGSFDSLCSVVVGAPPRPLPAPPPPPHVMMKLDAKAFFSNERTMLSWLNVAVLLSSTSVALLNLHQQFATMCGRVIAPVAVLFLLYSFIVGGLSLYKRETATTPRSFR
eukprot:GHVT01078925.1.p2 GENE.GHVT01078925.1~~GHVT01078925.1.p2  ORF type:complete len:157 (+),score=32.33 GHVT01078925.1:903-1373(+)